MVDFDQGLITLLAAARWNGTSTSWAVRTSERLRRNVGLDRGTLSRHLPLKLATMEVNPMNPTFSIFVATTLLLASSYSAVAAREAAAGNRNVVIAPIPQISTAPPQTNPIGGVNQNFDPLAGSAQTNPVTGEAFGASPGAPGSPTYDPNAALNNPGSALAPLAPLPGTTAPGTGP
jgi:hypothetical protein